MSRDKIGYSVREAVEASGLTRTLIFELVAAGDLQSKMIGRRRIITAKSLRRLVEGTGDVPSSASRQRARDQAA